MITAEQIGEILSLYKKHGWNLRRVLLSEELKKNLSAGEAERLFGKTPSETSKINAVWFSRPSKKNRTAWELRHLSETPFALFEMFDETSDQASLRKAVQKKLENRLAESTSNKNSGKQN